MQDLFESTPRRTRRWVVGLLSWLGIFLIAEMATDQSLLVDIAILFGLPVAYGTAGWLILRKRPRLPSDERKPWSLLAVGVLAIAGGMLAMVVVSLVTPRLTAFGPLDLVFIAAIAIGLIGLARLPQLKTEEFSRQRLLLDGLIGAIAIAALMWVFIGRDLYAQLSDSPQWDLVIGSAYPILDFAGFVVVMLVVLRRSSYRFDPRLMAVGLTFLAQGFGDILYFRAGIGSGFLEANPILSLHIVAAASMVVCALLIDRPAQPREFAERDTPWVALLAPYGAAFALGSLTFTQILAAERLNAGLRFLLVATGIVGLLVMVRQFLAIRDNRALVDRERDALVSSISHELRTPLTAIVGYLDLLTQPGNQQYANEREELLLVSKEQADHLSRMVSDLILAARENPRSLDLQREQTLVRPLIEETLLHTDSSIAAIVDCPEDLTADIDPQRVHQALINLVINSDRYGSSKCQIVVRKRGRRLFVEVHDDGPGVPERYREAVWKRFERGAHRLDASQPGSGLGLALVEIIARAHGGMAAYRRSERLGGACFQMVLPEPAIVESRALLPVGVAEV